MLSVYKNIIIYFYYAVLLFYFPICLEVECNRKLVFNTKEVAEQRPEIRDKYRSIISENGVWAAIILHHHVDDNFY